MALLGFDVPVGGILFIGQGNAALILCCCVGGKNGVAKAISGVNSGSIFIWDPGLREDCDVNVLGLQCSADRD